MKAILLSTFFISMCLSAFAQKDVDSAILRMPLVGNKLIYADSISLPNHTQKILDTTVKKWFVGYFKHYRPDTLSKDRDPQASILEQAAVEFKMTTTSVALVKWKFYLVMSIKIICRDNGYSYKISDIFFMPENKTMRAVGYYQHSPEYLLDLYKKEHLGFEPAIDMGRKKIAEYLTNVNSPIQNAIASLKKAMTN